LAKFNVLTVASGAVVIIAILLYSWLHKRTAWAVLIMAWCRFQWAITAALAVGAAGIGWLNFAHGAYLFGYIVLVSLTARQESKPRAAHQNALPARWRSRLLAVGLMLVLLRAPHGIVPMLPWVCFIIWFRGAEMLQLRGPQPRIGRFVGLTLAAVTLLDTVFACVAWSWSGLWLALMLPLCLLLQRRIAAT
jgi:hypothetical protein